MLGIAVVFLVLICPNRAFQSRSIRINAAKRPQILFATPIQQQVATDDSTTTSSRILGSQELLMFPRQYGPSEATFPSMNHVSVALLNKVPPRSLMEQAVDYVMRCHPLLQSTVEGTGEPDKRIDLFQMVREGEPDPLRFVSKGFGATSVVTESTLPWQEAFGKDLDDNAWFQPGGPLWKLQIHSDAILFSFNHAISDQSSANRLLHQILSAVATLEQGESLPPAVLHEMPLSLEESTLGPKQTWKDVQMGGVSLRTAQYVAGKAAEGLRDPVLLPSNNKNENSVLGSLSIIAGQTAGGKDSTQRSSTLQFRTLSSQATDALLNKCRSEGVSMSNALTAAVTLTASDFVDETRNYKMLQSLDMRRFGSDQGETVACMAGSMDLMHGPFETNSGEKLRSGKLDRSIFWDLAREGKAQTIDFIDKGGPEEAVRVFDFAMTIADLNNLVYLTSQSKDTQGRAYSAGVTNAGVYEKLSTFTNPGDPRDKTLKLQYGQYKVNNIYYATPHTQSGCLFQVSCMTVDNQLQMTFNPVSPIVSASANEEFADSFVELLELAGGVRTVERTDDTSISLPPNILTTTAVVLGSITALSHASAWASFFSSVSQMKANVEDPADFWAALNFWIFFAVGHPILQPILWISDVLHASPGPKIADLVPVTFVAGNAVAIWAVSKFKDLRNAVNITALAAFFAYVGAGLDGTAGMGDFNLALDDNYKGQIVKGCPVYEDVRQSSMDTFDLNKYQGQWYEHKFHDWTQFKEVYDTSLGIKLTEGGQGWIDDFGVKGPAPASAKLSWDKSPVANGAHYFLFGRVDPNDPPGILREKGFGVEFPNYIVDVQKDANGDYKEAIQFQCLERGGVRVFEGINFMSRNEVMTEDEMEAMHKRAEKAGMYPYGASPEQMHTVARRPSTEPPIDNSWQAMWRAIGFDKLLELLTESIEDGGR